MEKDLRRARGTLTEDAFNRAAAMFHRMDQRNLAVAKAFLVSPGQMQVDIAQAKKISRQLVNKHCKKLYEAHCLIVEATRDRSDV